MASAYYLDAAILAKHSLPTASPDTTPRIATSDDGDKKTAVVVGGEGEGEGDGDCGEEARAAVRPMPVTKESYAGPMVIMSDSDNYLAGANNPRRRGKGKCGACCVG